MVPALELPSRRLTGWLDHVRQGREAVPTHQFPKRDKRRSEPRNRKAVSFLGQTAASQHLLLKRDHEGLEKKTIGDIEEGRKEQLPPSPILPFRGISVTGIPFLQLPLRGHSPHMEERERVSRLDVKLEGMRSACDLKPSVTLAPQTSKGGPGSFSFFSPTLLHIEKSN